MIDTHDQVTELGGEGVGHRLIAAAEPEDFAFEDRQTKASCNRLLRNAEQS